MGPEDDESTEGLPSHAVPFMQGAAYPQAATKLGNLGSGKKNDTRVKGKGNLSKVKSAAIQGKPQKRLF